jgi:hypothetical protein
MAKAEFSDAVVSHVLVNVRDDVGRRASISSEAEGLVFHDHRPRQGKKSVVPYDRLLDLALEGNDNFFDPPRRRK